MTIPPITRPQSPGQASAAPAAPAQLPQAPAFQIPRPMFSALAIASSGLSAQRVRMDVVAQNLANAETTRTPEGGPYHRRTVTLEPVLPQPLVTTPLIIPNTPIAGMPAPSLSPSPFPSSPIAMTNDVGGVRVAAVGEDRSDGPMVYNPGSPDADANGYVRMPNVNMTDELMDLMNARRVYEANATVFQVARAMLHKATEI